MFAILTALYINDAVNLHYLVFNQGVFYMDFASAQVIGAGLAAIGVGAAAIGVGYVFGSFLESRFATPPRPTASRAGCSSASRPPSFLAYRVRRCDDHPLRVNG